jgi:hypothetical protein
LLLLLACCCAVPGPEADQFAFSAWPDLRTAGGMRPVSELWLDTLPGELTDLDLLRCALSSDAAQLGTNKQMWQSPCSELWLNTLPGEG